jgi:hypothetical protein
MTFASSQAQPRICKPWGSIDEVGDRTALNHECAIRGSSAELEIGIEQHCPLGRAGSEPDGNWNSAAIAKLVSDAPRAYDPEIAATDMGKRGPQQPVHGRPRHVEPRPVGSEVAPRAPDVNSLASTRAQILPNMRPNRLVVKEWAKLIHLKSRVA